MSQLPKYTKEKMKGNIGEALVQYILSRFCLVHKIDGSSDIGNDFICELIKDQFPTNLLFYIQVKYTKRKPKIKKTTLEYWKTSPIPVYLFWIKKVKLIPIPIDRQPFLVLEKYYKRFTPLLHEKKSQSSENFKPFNEFTFRRDLIVDYIRTQYEKGATPIIKPRDFLSLDDKLRIGFGPYKLFIGDVIPKYSKQILSLSWVNMFSAATLLFRKRGRDNLALALDIIKNAKRLCSREDRETFSIIYHKMTEYEQRIRRELGKT